MEKDVFNYYCKGLSDNSVKKACYTTREFLRYLNKEELQRGNFQLNNGCAVNGDDFMNAINVLLAYSFENSKEKDNEVELYECDSDCSHNYGCGNFCPGEFSLNRKEKPKHLCKYFSDSYYI